jgi:hypothetical protein
VRSKLAPPPVSVAAVVAPLSTLRRFRDDGVTDRDRLPLQLKRKEKKKKK